MQTPGQLPSSSAGIYATGNDPTGGAPSPFSITPPRDTRHKSKRVVAVAESTATSPFVDERSPLLAQSEPSPRPSNTRLSILVILSSLILLPSLVYFIMHGPSDAVDYKSLYIGANAQIQRLTASNVALEQDVKLYKDMYEDLRVKATRLEQANVALEEQVQRLTTSNLALGKEVKFYKDMYEDVLLHVGHLEQANVALEDEIHDLQTIMHDLRGQLRNSKVSAFWEIARTMNPNMDIWVGADDMGHGPKFWSFGITNGLFNDNDPPVTSIKRHFADRQAAIFETWGDHRIVGYKVESDRENNGWWIATGLDEFGQGGSHEVKFEAKPTNHGAEYEVTVFYADWKL